MASEFFLGHTLSSYEKSPKYNEEFFRNEYRKVEPYLNIVSNPLGSKSGDEAIRATRREFNKLHLLAAKWKEEELVKLGDLADLTTEKVHELAEQKAAHTSIDPRNNEIGNNFTQQSLGR